MFLKKSPLTTDKSTQTIKILYICCMERKHELYVISLNKSRKNLLFCRCETHLGADGSIRCMNFCDVHVDVALRRHDPPVMTLLAPSRTHAPVHAHAHHQRGGFKKRRGSKVS